MPERRCAKWARPRASKARQERDTKFTALFDAIDHEWMLRFLEHRIADKRLLRLIRKWLKAGVLEEGRRQASRKGSPQGATLSPLLANVYLHYAYDLWVHHWRRRHASGDVIVVRYADDAVVAFQYEEDARAFLVALRERLQRFKLELPRQDQVGALSRRRPQERRTRG